MDQKVRATDKQDTYKLVIMLIRMICGSPQTIEKPPAMLTNCRCSSSDNEKKNHFFLSYIAQDLKLFYTYLSASTTNFIYIHVLIYAYTFIYFIVLLNHSARYQNAR